MDPRGFGFSRFGASESSFAHAKNSKSKKGSMFTNGIFDRDIVVVNETS
ncbi:hypothetical protein C943_03851 [Mariniradius saccharolyticus AK6]|uniref:Uncharacterized protein n=1 Tax=Mariniradius saccharolyticus AK6 TaxID=1239962 RepID=M7X9E2_9BACT|nr:hypothetical protein C943_03851 [Mariniradius saccharolyticus AK6]